MTAGNAKCPMCEGFFMAHARRFCGPCAELRLRYLRTHLERSGFDALPSSDRLAVIDGWRNRDPRAHVRRLPPLGARAR